MGETLRCRCLDQSHRVCWYRSPRYTRHPGYVRKSRLGRLKRWETVLFFFHPYRVLFFVYPCIVPAVLLIKCFLTCLMTISHGMRSITRVPRFCERSLANRFVVRSFTLFKSVLFILSSKRWLPRSKPNRCREEGREMKGEPSHIILGRKMDSWFVKENIRSDN